MVHKFVSGVGTLVPLHACSASQVGFAAEHFAKLHKEPSDQILLVYVWLTRLGIFGHYFGKGLWYWRPEQMLFIGLATFASAWNCWLLF